MAPVLQIKQFLCWLSQIMVKQLFLLFELTLDNFVKLWPASTNHLLEKTVSKFGFP